jgi:hypothetical protein
MNEARHDEAKHAPFDTARLDPLLEDEGIDILVATSKHNVQYLLGGYGFSFFDYMDAIGVSRYLPVVVYQTGRPDNTAYIGHPMESNKKELGKFWPRAIVVSAFSPSYAVPVRPEFTPLGNAAPYRRRAYPPIRRSFMAMPTLFPTPASTPMTFLWFRPIPGTMMRRASCSMLRPCDRHPVDV